MVTRREGTRRSEEKGEIKCGGRMRGGRARAKGGKKPLLLFHRLVISSFDFIICYPSLFVTRASENWGTKVTNNTYDDRRSGVRFRDALESSSARILRSLRTAVRVSRIIAIHRSVTGAYFNFGVVSSPRNRPFFFFPCLFPSKINATPHRHRTGWTSAMRRRGV